MKELLWSNEALADYEQNLIYLTQEWSEKSAKRYIAEVDAVLKVIKTNPRLFPLSEYRGIRKAVIRKQVTLYYLETATQIIVSLRR